jgi:putative DNA primase/helicase
MIAAKSPALAETLQPGQYDIYAGNPTVVEPADVTKQLQNIPEELKALSQWVVWKAVPDYDKDMKLKPKPRKVPINVSTGSGARPNDHSTWGTFEAVEEFLQEWAGEEHTHFDRNGVEITGTVSKFPGFMFHQKDPYCGIDLDDCRDPDTGEVTSWAKKIIDHFNSYTEFSQSGTGFHIIIKGMKPTGSICRKGDIECYDRDRYFVFTGEVLHAI